MDNSKLLEATEFFEKLKENGPLKRLGKLFRTRNNGYIYDVGTSKVLQCEKLEYAILENIFENNGAQNLNALNLEDSKLIAALDNVLNTITEENLLKAPKLTTFASVHSDFKALKGKIENNLEQITLELTERCNLRCKYCIYSDENESYRGFDVHDMTWETAKAAIDYGLQHSGKNLAITFYGGEPLLHFDLIKKCVEYSQKNARGKELGYSMTTNLTLMTKEIAEYLASINSFSVVCSIDGPKEIHDENRLTVNGKGSFDKAIQGLKYLVDAYGQKAEVYLLLSMVVSLPADDEKLSKMQQFFDELDWLPVKITKNLSYVASSADREKRLSRKPDEKLDDIAEYVNPLGDWTAENTVFDDKIDSNAIFTHSFMQAEYLKIHKRIILDEPTGYYGLNGCCIPASRRLYITVAGNFMICEKIGNSPYIGDVKSGIDWESVKKHYIDAYINEAKSICGDCWAIRLCGNCYIDCYDEKEFRPEYKRDQCDISLYQTEQELVYYHEMLERNPEKLKYLNDILLS